MDSGEKCLTSEILKFTGVPGPQLKFCSPLLPT